MTLDDETREALGMGDHWDRLLVSCMHSAWAAARAFGNGRHRPVATMTPTERRAAARARKDPEEIRRMNREHQRARRARLAAERQNGGA